MDIVEKRLCIRDAVDSEPGYHLFDTLGTERVLGIDVDHAAVHAALFLGQLDVDCQLVDDLAFTGTEFTVEFGDCLCFEAAAEKCIDFGDPERELFDLLPLLEDVFSGTETADICGLAGGFDDLLCRGFRDLCDLGKLGRRGGCNALDRKVSCFAQLVSGGRPDPGQILYLQWFVSHFLLHLLWHNTILILAI